MYITVAIDDTKITGLLDRLKARTRDLTPAMKIVGEIVRSSVIRNFMQGGRPDKWTPTKGLSSYITRRAGSAGRKRKTYTLKSSKGSAHPAGKKTLIDTGRLKNSITSRAYSNKAVVGTNVIYAAIHQFGGKAGRGRKTTIPARPFLMVHNEDWAEIKKVLERELLK